MLCTIIQRYIIIRIVCYVSGVKTINSYVNDNKLKTRVNQTIISHTIKGRNQRKDNICWNYSSVTNQIIIDLHTFLVKHNCIINTSNVICERLDNFYYQN